MPADVVADETESRNFGVLLDGSTKGRLGGGGHGIGLIQDDDFEGWLHLSGQLSGTSNVRGQG